MPNCHHAVNEPAGRLHSVAETGPKVGPDDPSRSPSTVVHSVPTSNPSCGCGGSASLPAAPTSGTVAAPPDSRFASPFAPPLPGLEPPLCPRHVDWDSETPMALRGLVGAPEDYPAILFDRECCPV